MTNGRPSKVKDHREYWGKPPPERSPRCAWWLAQIESGWRPNRRLGMFGYDEAAEWFGVYIWEYLNVLAPALRAVEIESR